MNDAQSSVCASVMSFHFSITVYNIITLKRLLHGQPNLYSPVLVTLALVQLSYQCKLGLRPQLCLCLCICKTDLFTHFHTVKNLYMYSMSFFKTSKLKHVECI